MTRQPGVRGLGFFFIVATLVSCGVTACSPRAPVPNAGSAPIPPLFKDSLEFEKEVWAALAKLDVDEAKKEDAQETARRELAALAEKYRDQLRTAKDIKTFISEDSSGNRVFVLVVAAKGADATASDDEALLVMAIAGEGAAAQGGQPAGQGGQAQVKAPAGLAVAIGGRGGLGGGTGGEAKAEGKLGGLAWGGAGGKGIGGGGGGGGGGGSSGEPVDIEAVAEAAKKRSTTLNPK